MGGEENRIEITGRLARDPTLSPTGAGRPVCDLRLTAHNGRHPSFDIDVGVFDAAAETCVARFSEGDEVRIEGELRFRRWRDRVGRWHRDFSIAGTVEPLEAASSDYGAESRRSAVAAPDLARMPTPEEHRRLLYVRAGLRGAVPESTFNLWLKPLRFGGITHDAVHVVAPRGKGAWVERRYSALIADVLRSYQLPDRVSFAAVRIAANRADDGRGRESAPSKAPAETQ